MKKFLSLFVVSAMVVSLCACGSTQNSGNADAADATEETATETTEAETEDSTQAEETADGEATDGEAAATGVMPAIAKEDIKVGVIHITDPAEGSGYTYTHDLGIQGMQKNIGLDDSQIVRKNNVSDSDATAIENAMRECVEEGCNIIFATSWGFMDTCEALAEEYPDVIFSHGTGYKSNGVNFNNYFGRIYQARYLAGIAAGMKTESNKLGYVAAMGQENSEVTGGINAFAMGAYSVNPDCEVYVKLQTAGSIPKEKHRQHRHLLTLDVM